MFNSENRQQMIEDKQDTAGELIENLSSQEMCADFRA